MTKNPGLAFGMTLAAVFLVLTLTLDGVSGAAVFMLLIGLLLLAMAWLPWTRLGLRSTSIGMAAAAVALLATGSLMLRDLDLALESLPLLAVLLAAAPLLMLLDRRGRPQAWERWRQALQEASLVDVLRSRHIPRAE